MPQCLFCKIIAGEVPCTKVFENDHAVAFADINPQAPEHILVIPRTHCASVHEIEPGDTALMGDLFSAVAAVIALRNLAADGYRLVINSGKNGGQLVPHIHVHILGGRAMAWPPG